MDLTNISVIKNILKMHGLWASKKLGQNFLISKSVLDKIIKSPDIKKEDTILEIGPGIGTLTKELCKKGGKVIAVEKDSELINVLNENVKEFNNLKIINSDILNFNLEKEIKGSYKVVANIPYYITSHLIRKFMEEKFKPSLIVLMVQKEVAERIIASPPKMNLLSVSVKFYAKPELISYVSSDSFYPKPKVDSAIIKIIINDQGSRIKGMDEKKFFRIVKIGFSSPRKKLINNLSGGLMIPKEEVHYLLSKANIDVHVRAQELSIDDWLRLYKELLLRLF